MGKFILQIALISPISLLAQEYTLVTDRPDITESAIVLPTGILQAEHGIQYLSTAEKQGEFSLPTLLRYGIGGRTEFRATIQSAFSHNNAEDISGILPLALGLKISLADESRFTPQMALLAQLELPTVSSPAFRDDYTGLSVMYLGSYDIPGALAIGYNMGIQFDGINLQPIYPYSVSVGINLSEKLAVFVEHYATITKEEFNINGDGGFTWLIHPHMQVDGSAGYSWATNQPFAGLGYSWFISTRNK